MDLSVKELSAFLMIPEKEIMKMVKSKLLPFHKAHDKILFNKQQAIEWALINNHPINLSTGTLFREYVVDSILPMVDASSFHYACPFTETDYIGQMVERVDFKQPVDRDVVIQLLKSREQLMSTAIGNGIALPHPRIPLVLGQDKPIIQFFFPERFLALNSIDGQPVHTLILIISQTIRQHLSLLAHLSYLLSKSEFQEALRERYAFDAIAGIIERLESVK